MNNEELIESILSECKTDIKYLGPSTKTKGDHLKVTLFRKRKQMTFDFHDNYYNDSDLREYIRCLCVDSEIAEEQNWTVEEFRLCFDYDENKYSTKYIISTLKQLERNNKGLHRLFTNDEIKVLREGLDN